MRKRKKSILLGERVPAAPPWIRQCFIQSRNTYTIHAFRLLYGQGFGLLFLCSGTPNFYQTFGNVYIPILTILSAFVCVCSGHAKIKYRRPYPIHRRLLQIGCCTLQIIFLYIPMYYRHYHCSVAGTNSDSADEYLCHTSHHHTKYTLWFFPSIFCFVFHAPEYFSPGLFDFIGHGHQWFHVLITITTLYQFEAGYHDLSAQSHRLLVLSTVQATVVSVFGSVALVIMLDLFYILSSQNKVTEAVEKHRKHLVKGETFHSFPLLSDY